MIERDKDGNIVAWIYVPKHTNDEEVVEAIPYILYSCAGVNAANKIVDKLIEDFRPMEKYIIKRYPRR